MSKAFLSGRAVFILLITVKSVPASEKAAPPPNAIFDLNYCSK